MFEPKEGIYTEVQKWVGDNPTHDFYLYASQQTDIEIYRFCLAVIEHGKIPVIITNVGTFRNSYPNSLKMAMDLSSDIRIYESAKIGTDIVLQAKAQMFIKINGGILWTPT